MPVKRLRSGKNISGETMAKLSFSAKEQLSEAVKKQFMETMNLPAEFEKESGRINSMGYYILRIGHDMNEYCEAVSGKAVFKKQQTEICGLLSNLCEKAAEFIERKEVAFIRKIPQENIFVEIDRERFYYAVLNLLLNSAENTPEGGRIRVAVSKTKRFVKITVGDNGFGIDEEGLTHCFEPFYTKNNSAGRKKMGLGLTLAHYFAAESGGRMNISSEIGKGTAVSLLIPMMDSEKVNLSLSASSPDIPGEKYSPVYIVFSGLE